MGVLVVSPSGSVRVASYLDHNLGLQPLQGQLTGIIHVIDLDREGDVSPLGRKGGICVTALISVALTVIW